MTISKTRPQLFGCLYAVFNKIPLNWELTQSFYDRVTRFIDGSIGQVTFFRYLLFLRLLVGLLQSRGYIN